jgi:hypothetical protein
MTHSTTVHWTIDPEKLKAHYILDDVRAGWYQSQIAIVWALRVLGEPVQP